MAQTRDESRSQRSDVERPLRSLPESGARRDQGSLARRGPFGLRHFADPFSLMNDLRMEMDRFFRTGDIDRSLWTPSIEMYEKDGKLHVCADLPGLKKEDVALNFSDDMLTIEGERKSDRKDEQGGWNERTYGRFFRTIQLPEGINAENAKASFKDGVLDVVFDAPKPMESRGRRIEIG